MKKFSKQPKKNKSTPITELIKDNHYLHQYCDFINTENQKNSLKCFELMSYLTTLEKLVKDNNKMLEFVVQNLNPKTLEKMKKEFEEKGMIVSTSKSVEQKTYVFHDDITVKCPNCKSISTIKDKSCKECGFKI